MKRSEDRILTTHAGSLPRPDDLVRMMWDWLEGKDLDEEKVRVRIREAVREVVERQRELGIDLVSDGEMGKVGFSNYVLQRFTGFGGSANFMAKDLADVPSIIEKVFGTEAGQHLVLPTCTGPIEDLDPDAVQRDIANLRAALGGEAAGAFMPAVTPGQVTFNFPNCYYGSHEEYLQGAADVLKDEYRAIVDAGFDVQFDSPDLAMAGHCVVEGSSLESLEKHIPLAIEMLNEITKDLPPEKMRLHVCWGNYLGPHHHDVRLRDIVEPILKTRAGAIYFEAANPQHEHEWDVWKEVELPDDKVLIPGVIDSHTNHVEHPELVAQRIERFASIVGKERVVAGTDCGFGTFVGWSCVEPETAWLKLRSLVEGARIASDRLW